MSYQQAPPPPANIPNYLVQAILVAIFCCLPFGIVAIVFAAQVNSALAAGNYEAAMESSRKARTWTIVSLVVGLIGVVIWVILMLAGTAMPFFFMDY